MSDHTVPADGRASTAVPADLGWAVAALTGAAGAIHFAMVPAHAGGGLGEPLAFAAAAWFQVVLAALILSGRADRRTHAIGAAGNAVILGAWVVSRTVGLPWGDHAGEAEAIGLVDGIAAGLEAAAVVLGPRLVLGPAERRRSTLVPVLSAVGAVALATLAITAPETANHGHGDTAAPLDAHSAEMARIAATRCDRGFNAPGYWQETATLGVDTIAGGNMVMGGTGAAPAATSSGDGHSHGGAAAPAAAVTTMTRPDPLRGRGSEGLDKLVTSTKAAGKGEAAAGQLIVDLAEADDTTYDAWLWWLQSTNQVGHAHSSAAPDEGHGGHAGPHPWTAITDRADCKRLTDELARARAAALRLPTAQDAIDAGYHRVTYYLPGIGAHYIKKEFVDDRFDVDEPEMILYDGNEPDASVVGLSYYLIGNPDVEPSQGFTGVNDHFHRHVGLCMARGVIVGDTTMSEEECTNRGGVKLMTVGGWMNHAWVVPGCESPWGVFSAASPVLDGELGDASGTDGGGCAASGVRDRYLLDAPAPTAAASGAAAGATGTGEAGSGDAGRRASSSPGD